MVFLAKVVKKGVVSEFTTSKGEKLPKIDLVLAQGKERLLVTAFDKLALIVKDVEYDAADVYVCDISFSVVPGKQEGSMFQNIRLNDIHDF